MSFFPPSAQNSVAVALLISPLLISYNRMLRSGTFSFISQKTEWISTATGTVFQAHLHRTCSITGKSFQDSALSHHAFTCYKIGTQQTLLKTHSEHYPYKPTLGRESGFIRQDLVDIPDHMQHLPSIK